MASENNALLLKKETGINTVQAYPIFDLGLIDYKSALRYQREMFTEAKNGTFKSALIICRHFPVITLGRRADKNNILAGGIELVKRGISVYEIERGGDVTYHGPGQLIAYPIFNLNFFKKDIHWFLRRIESVIISVLSDFGVDSARRPGYTGVWVKGQKIASIGIAIRNWITFHGVSLNITTNDLENFRVIRPCGMDIEMTSLETVLGHEINIDNVKEKIAGKFADFWNYQ